MTHVARNTKSILNRLHVFTVSSFHAFICARSPSLLNNLLSGRGATKRRPLSRSNSGSSRRSMQVRWMRRFVFFLFWYSLHAIAHTFCVTNPNRKSCQRYCPTTNMCLSHDLTRFNDHNSNRNTRPDTYIESPYITACDVRRPKKSGTKQKPTISILRVLLRSVDACNASKYRLHGNNTKTGPLTMPSVARKHGNQNAHVNNYTNQLPQH